MPVSEHDVVQRAVGIFRRELEDENQHIEDALRVALRAVFADATEVERLREENERLRAFAFGPAPEWEQANATLKHEARGLRAEVERLREALMDLIANAPCRCDMHLVRYPCSKCRARAVLDAR